jgi:hypothetical protein
MQSMNVQQKTKHIKISANQRRNYSIAIVMTIVLHYVWSDIGIDAGG